MAIGGPVRELGRFLDECERGDREVRSVEIETCPDTDRTCGVTADVEIALPVPQSGGSGRGLALESPRVGPDGTLRFGLESVGSLVPSGEYDVAVDPTGGTIGPDGSVSVTLRATALADDPDEDPAQRRERGPTATPDRAGSPGSPDDATDTGSDVVEAASEAEAGSDRDLPPFKDPDLLRSIFESHDTFAEMADAIEMDVTAETVRRYMIDYDIHQPNSYRTNGSDGEAEGDAESRTEATDDRRHPPKPTTEPSAGSTDVAGEPVVISDGIGLPEDVTAETLIDTVKRSNTLYEVTRDIDIDRQGALEMLQELNLLDLVVGRLATEGERDIGRDEIVERLREASATS